MSDQKQMMLEAEVLVPNGIKDRDAIALTYIALDFSEHSVRHGYDDWRKMAEQNILVVLRRNDDARGIVGMATLVVYKVPTGLKGLVEDVAIVVGAQGLGGGTKLLNCIIRVAKEKGLRHIDLTSRPSRIEANSLYQKLGFQKRETNVYRLTL